MRQIVAHIVADSERLCFFGSGTKLGRLRPGPKHLYCLNLGRIQGILEAIHPSNVTP